MNYSFKDIITGGWARRFQANLTYFLGPTLVGPHKSERSEVERYMSPRKHSHGSNLDSLIWTQHKAGPLKYWTRIPRISKIQLEFNLYLSYN